MEPKQIGQILNLVKVEGEQVPTELMPSKTGDSCRQICHIESLETVKQALRYVMVLVGLRGQNLPTEEEKIILLNHIKKYYSGHTPEEIRKAFELAVSGELDCDAVCYENFSVLYFSTIMNAYRKWVTENGYRPPLPVMIEMPKPEISTDDLHRYDVEMFYQRCRKGIVPNAIPEYFKDILTKDGLLKEETVAEYLTRKLGEQSENIYVKE